MKGQSFSFYVEKVVEKNDLTATIANCFNLPKDAVIFSDQQDNPLNGEILIVDYHTYENGFELYVTLYSKQGFSSRFPNDMAIATNISKALKKNILISDESLNPYSWILIKTNGEIYKVYEKINDNDDDFKSGIIIDPDSIIPIQK